MKWNRNLSKGVLPTFATIFSVAFLGGMPAAAAEVFDPPNDFLSSFTGPKNPDLDVLSANVTLDGSNLDFTATLNGTVGQTPGAVYVFGINRGEGSSKFSNIGAPEVLFDSVFVIKTSGASVVNDLISGTSTAISDVTLSGSTIAGIVPVADLPSEGFDVGAYQYNLWPEAGAANPGNTEISDFAPDNSDAPINDAPEPAT